MSGICGIVDFCGTPADADLLRKMAEAAAHRGPDGIHYWMNGNVGFAHLALNATPESLRERQPMLNADGLLCLTADARVDNREELIGTLTSKGCLRENNPTDAELILAAYECWGVECPVRILGGFAFAIWDARRRQLLCVRDALGVKPLHYSRVGRTLCFASEVEQIIQNPEVPHRLDEVAMADYLAMNFYDQASTMFLDVRRLPPAHRLIVTQAWMRMDRYWDVNPQVRNVYRRDEDYAAHFLHLFRRAVADRLRTGARATGIAMSGGLDSCSIGTAARESPRTNGSSPRLVAYTWVFDHLSDCDERAYSGAMAAELGINIDYIPAERFWFLREPVVFRPSLESPFLWNESVIRHMLAQLKEQGGQVLLTGEGGDSLLWGTRRFVYADRQLRRHIGLLWELARRARNQGVPYHRLMYNYIVRPLMPDSLIRDLRRLTGRDTPSGVPEWISPDFTQRTGLAERLAHPPVPRRFSSLARQDMYRLAVALSVRPAIYWYDNTAASFGLEARHPFLDRRLVEFVLSIPPEQLFRGERRKLILRRAMVGMLPEVIRRRRHKTIFNSFADLSLREKEVEQINGLLKTPFLGKMGIVDAVRLRSAYEEYLAGRGGKPVTMLFPPITLELWLRKYYAMFENGPCGESFCTVPLSAAPTVDNRS